MRVLHVAAGHIYGGAEKVIETLARERHRCPGLDQAFALCFEGKLETGLHSTGASVDLLGQVRFRRPDLLLKARRRLFEVVERTRPDMVVIHSVWSHVAFAATLRRVPVPIAVWVHDVMSGHHWLERGARRWPPDLLVCNSRYTEAAARTVFPGVPSEIIHGPTSLDVAPARDTSASSSTVAPARLVIAHVSRMVPLKGHRLLLDALARLPVAPDWECWFVGGAQSADEERYESELRDRVAALGLAARVHFLGATDDVMRILRRCHIYCQPNELPEAFGLSLVEALHAGLPVVSTELGGAKEIVTDACGRLVPPGDVDELALTLRWLLERPAAREALGRNGPQRAWALCNPEVCLAKLNAALERVVTRAAA